MKRRIAVFGRLPERQTSADRIANMDSDVRDLTAQMRQRVRDKALTMSVTGFVLDEDSYEVAVNGRTLVMSAVAERAD